MKSLILEFKIKVLFLVAKVGKNVSAFVSVLLVDSFVLFCNLKARIYSEPSFCVPYFSFNFW